MFSMSHSALLSRPPNAKQFHSHSHPHSHSPSPNPAPAHIHHPRPRMPADPAVKDQSSPRKRNHGRRRADARKNASVSNTDTAETTPNEDEELFDILGVSKVPQQQSRLQPGLLPIPQTQNAQNDKKRTRTKNKNNRKSPPRAEPLDVSDLSKSLPTSFLADKQWDMPAPVGGQQLTWQQLDSPSATPSKPAKKTRNAKPRASCDLDTTNFYANNRAQHAPVPVHAPQTPPRVPVPHTDAITLPIVGEFPRINKMPMTAGPKYAGPTFHNSPASGSLPQPDLDDF